MPGFPTLKIKQTCLEFLLTVAQEHYGTITGPVQGGWTPDHNPREAYDYVDLLEGQNVYIEVEYGTWTAGEGSALIHSGCDVIDLFVWPPGVEHTHNNSLVGASTATSANPEIGTFVAPVTGTYTIGLDYYSGNPTMGWRVYIYTYRALGGALHEGRSAVEDTADILDFNGNFDVRLRRITGTSLDLDESFSSHVIRNIDIINYFPPNVTVLSPGEYTATAVYGPNPIRISWSGADLNTDEVLQYSVEISNDLGETWKIIAYTTQNTTLWDPTSSFYGLPPTPWEADGQTRIPTFLVRVNVTDGRFYASDTSDHPWVLDGRFNFVIGDNWAVYIVIIVTWICLVIIAITFILGRVKRVPRKK